MFRFFLFFFLLLILGGLMVAFQPLGNFHALRARLATWEFLPCHFLIWGGGRKREREEALGEGCVLWNSFGLWDIINTDCLDDWVSKRKRREKTVNRCNLAVDSERTTHTQQCFGYLRSLVEADAIFFLWSWYFNRAESINIRNKVNSHGVTLPVIRKQK